MRRKNSPSSYGFHPEQRKKNRMTAGKTNGGRPGSGRLGFLVVILLMFSTAVILAVGAGNRTAGVAWGGLPDSDGPEEFVLPSSGFIVVDMSSVYINDDGNEMDLQPFRPEGAAAEASSRPSKPADREKPVFEWKFPDRVVVSSGSDGVSGAHFRNSGTSDLSGFRFKLPDRLPVEGGSYGISDGQFSNTGVSRLSGFQFRLPESLPVEGYSFGVSGARFFNSGQSRFESFRFPETEPAVAETAAQEGTPTSEDNLPGKMESDYNEVVLSIASDGKDLPPVDDPEISPEEEEVVLTEVKPLWKEYIVKAGETMSDIAVSFGIAVSDIVKANELKDPDRLSEKQLLLIPNTSDAVDATLEEVLTRKARILAAKEQVVPVKVKAYVVAQGDSLWSIASSQNLEIDTLFGCNDLKNPDMLKPGVTLRIPNQDGIFYTIKKGDTLDKIAKSYGIPVERIRKGNPADALDPLVANKEIFLPGARPEATIASSSPGRTRRSGSTVTASRSYRWPVVGKINSPFGWRRHPITRRRDFHTGIDIKAPRGRAIKVSKTGRVEYAGWMGGYGRVVVVRHNDGYSTLYAHCTSLSVRRGQAVSQGQTIATVGASGRATGPHLHFEIRRGNTPVNPLKLLR